MTETPILVEVTRADRVESVHRGDAVICDGTGAVVEAWGDPLRVIFPRSSCKMVQALPLVESGAADAFGLTSEHLALACASHEGAAIHTDLAADWLQGIDVPQAAFRCGPQMPRDRAAKTALIKTDQSPCPIHNNCSGKHAGFLTLSKYLGAGADYVDPAHPVQQAVRAATEETAGETSPGFGIDGCSAPNFALTLAGFGRQMAAFASAPQHTGARARAMSRLVNAMRSHPELVAGDGRACTELMQAADGAAAVKTGAEAVFVAILPELDRAIALKIEDGSTRASECAIAALLVRVGAVDYNNPLVRKRLDAPLGNWDGLEVGAIRAVSGLSMK